MSYISVEDLRSYLAVGTTGDATELTRICTAAQIEIERECHQTFEASSSGTRYYRSRDLVTLPEGSQYTPASRYAPLGSPGFSWDRDYGYSGGYGSRVLPLDKPLLTVSSLVNGDGTTISSTGYWLEPRNDPPYLYVRLRSSESWSFDTDGEIEVTGTWGYSTGPDATIVELTLEVAAYLYKLRDAPVFDVTATPELGIITVPKGVPAHVKRALHEGGYIRSVGRIIV